MQQLDWDSIINDSPLGSRPVPGHYPVRITGVTDHPEKQYLHIEFDIADGDYLDFAQDSYAWRQEARWPGWATINISYKPTCFRRFREFRDQLEGSNTDTHFIWNASVFDDLTKLEGLHLGIVYEEKPYQWNGFTGTHCVPVRTETIREARSAMPADPIHPSCRCLKQNHRKNYR